MNNLVKDNWNESDLNDLYNLLLNLGNPEKVDWTRNIVNTKMKLLAISSPKLREISKVIYKGNYLSFLDLMPVKYYECTIIEAYIISKIKDFKVQKKYILKLAKYIDNWSTVDTLKYHIKNNELNYLDFSFTLLKHKKPFYRRIGVRILFSFTNSPVYFNKVFELMDSLYAENDYYVNMANAWLLCEMFIKNRDETLNYLKHHKLNKFTINKGISKCIDSYRVTDDDKRLLKSFKVK